MKLATAENEWKHTPWNICFYNCIYPCILQFCVLQLVIIIGSIRFFFLILWTEKYFKVKRFWSQFAKVEWNLFYILSMILHQCFLRKQYFKINLENLIVVVISQVANQALAKPRIISSTEMISHASPTQMGETL